MQKKHGNTEIQERREEKEVEESVVLGEKGREHFKEE